MAIVTTTEIEAAELGGTFSRSWLYMRTPTRTPGVHVSDIISSLVKLVPSLAKTLDMEDDVKHGMWLMGLAWEDVVRSYLGWQGFEVTCDDIVCNPDIVVVAGDGAPCVDECKLTWKSVRRNILDDWRWMTQIKSYLYALGMNKGRFWVYHVNGNYAPPQPIILRHDITFTDREIQDNWVMMRTHLEYLKAQAAAEEEVGSLSSFNATTIPQFMGGINNDPPCSYCGEKKRTRAIVDATKQIVFICEECDNSDPMYDRDR